MRSFIVIVSFVVFFSSIVAKKSCVFLGNAKLPSPLLILIAFPIFCRPMLRFPMFYFDRDFRAQFYSCGRLIGKVLSWFVATFNASDISLLVICFSLGSSAVLCLPKTGRRQVTFSTISYNAATFPPFLSVTTFFFFCRVYVTFASSGFIRNACK